MTKKRNYHFIYSNNTDKEEYQVRKEFTEMIRDLLIKKGKIIIQLLFPLTAFIVLIAIFLEQIKSYISYIYYELNIDIFIAILWNSKLYNIITENKYILLLIMAVLLYFIVTWNKKWKK